MEVRRLRAGDEQLAIEAIETLKPEEERDGNVASQEHMRRVLESDENYLIVACEAGRPTGFLVAHRFPRVDRDRYMVYLYEIEVEQAFRRRGVGTRMIDLLKNVCREDQVMEIWVGTEEDNIPAKALYKATGAEEEPHYYREYVYSQGR